MVTQLTGRHALFLDIDGTLLDIAPTPLAVVVPPGLRECLHGLSGRLDGALAFLTGRRLADVDRLFGAEFAVAAEHGGILREAGGTAQQPARPAQLDGWLDQVLRHTAALRGVLVEPKQLGFTVHFRNAPELAARLHNMLREIVCNEAEILPARRAWEIHPAAVSKGAALNWFMTRPMFAGRVPLFVGDDVTDKSAIAAAIALGGVGLHVGQDFAGQPSAVRAWLQEIRAGQRDLEDAPHGQS